ncbi:MAG TPA: rhomboid family intramembrane serine protease, partial [Chitinophagales bacterium]|nr:rhomboid family intramembrane serine protease [Chitinophagales bacterium]
REEEHKLLYVSIFMPMVFIALMWIAHLFAYVTGIDLSSFGILPKHVSGLPGIIFSPFIHADWEHLLSNTVPFLVLGSLMIFNYRKVAFLSFVFIWIGGGLLLWLTGRENYHIGASGIIYGMAFFIFFSGVLRKNIQSIALSLFVVFLYGSIVWGLFPLDVRLSWEGHTMGALCGALAALYFRKVDLPPKIELEDDEDEDEDGDDIDPNNPDIRPSRFSALPDDVHYEIVEPSKHPDKK